MFRYFSFPQCRSGMAFCLALCRSGLQSLSHRGSKPGGILCAVCVEQSLASKSRNHCQLLTALQRLQMFILTTMSQRRCINSSRQLGVSDILVSSAYSFVLSQEGKEKKNNFFFFKSCYCTIHYLTLFCLNRLCTAEIPKHSWAPSRETEPYLPVSDELPVIKLAARNKTTRLRGSGWRRRRRRG